MTQADPSYFAPFIASLAAFFACAAGNTLNDILDIESDRINHPDRVLVKGSLSKRYVIILTVVFNFLALIFACIVSWSIFFIVALAIALLFAYNYFLKKTVFIGNIAIALLGGLTFITGGIAVSTEATFLLPGPLIPAVFSFLFHLIREIIKDIEDIKGDVEFDIKTLPQVIGKKASLWLALVLMIILIYLTLIPVLEGWFKGLYEIITIYFIDIPLLCLLILVIIKPTLKRLKVTSTALKVGMALGIIALLAA